MTTLYAVFRKGVYRHECGGIFDHPGKAVTAAFELAQEDNDDYHAYEVVPFELNQRTPYDDYPADYHSRNIEEAKSIYSVRKGDKR